MSNLFGGRTACLIERLPKEARGDEVLDEEDGE